MRPWLLRLAAIALLLGLPPALSPKSASACVCVYVYPDPLALLDEADAVIVGKAGAGAIGSVEFQVYRVWKGAAYATRTTVTVNEIHDDGSVSRTSCDPRIDRGEEYLIYAREDSAGTLRASTCHVFQLAYAQEQLEALGEGEPPVPGLEPPVPDLAPAEAGSDAEFPAWAIGLLVVAGVGLAGAGLVAIRRRARET